MQGSLKELSKNLDKIAAMRRVSLWHVFAAQGLHFGQLGIIEHIIQNEGCTQNDIAEMLNVSPASIALSTKRLQKAGMIKKCEDNENRRCNILTVTEKGLATVAQCRSELDLFDEKLFSGVSENERLLLSDILDRLLKNFSYDKVDFFKLMHEIHEHKKGRKKC
jgi:DNA-binding MarR family transcriptional regulator